MNEPIHILLADDDKDERFFFELALQESTVPCRLNTVEDGEQLMLWLLKNHDRLPDILFLDLNMPRKNGLECLTEIMSDRRLMKLNIIIYSTFLDMESADILYNKGALYFLKKTDMLELQKILQNLLVNVSLTGFKKPAREEFVISPDR